MEIDDLLDKFLDGKIAGNEVLAKISPKTTIADALYKRAYKKGWEDGFRAAINLGKSPISPDIIEEGCQPKDKKAKRQKGN